MPRIWQVAEARRHFAEIVDAASKGEPQSITRRDGSEVVVVSRSHFDATRPHVKTALLGNRFGTRGDAFDKALEEAGEVLSAAVAGIDRPDADRF
ncbi:MAG: type II toxin-antitoxin system prevent-host-death family antitoxin [Rhodopila sp.]